MLKGKQFGFTLLEILLASTIGSLIMAGAFTIYKRAQADQATKDTFEIVKTIFSDAQAATSVRNDFVLDLASGGTVDMTVDELVTAKGGIDEFPKGTFLVDADTLGHPMGGNITVVPQSSSGGGVKDLIQVRLTEVPRSSCSLLLNRLMGANIYDMYVDDKLVALTPAANANAIGRDEVRMDQATRICNEGGRYVTVRARQLKEIHYSKMRASPFGSTLSTQEAAIIGPLYARQEAALTAREAAQLAIP